jgi:hypothetical protein
MKERELENELTDDLNELANKIRVYSRSQKEFPKSNGDSSCDYSEFLCDDMLYSPFGEYKCMLQNFQYGEYNQNTDYHPCKEEDHLTCPFYIKTNSKGVNQNEREKL